MLSKKQVEMVFVLLLFCSWILENTSEAKSGISFRNKAGSSSNHSAIYIEDFPEYTDYIDTFAEEYIESEKHNSRRRKHYEERIRAIKKWNKRFERGEVSWKRGINFLTGRFPGELDWINSVPRGKKDKDAILSEPFSGEVPDEKDWRDEHIVSPVRNQGKCGSCYAFGIAGAIESQIALRKQVYRVLSPQMIVDCTKEVGNNGCGGGRFNRTYTWIKKHGIASEKCYPYKTRDGKCLVKKKKLKTYGITAFYTTRDGDEEQLKEAIANGGPMSIGVNADLQSFFEYTSGVFHDPKCVPGIMSHAMLLIGYGVSEHGKDYWLIKNSWGPGWGEKGYMRIARNHDNLCGVATDAYLPWVKKNKIIKNNF